MKHFTFSKAIYASVSAVALTGLLAADVAYAQVNNDEIIVTARKVEESIQDVPVSVTAFSSEDLFEKGIQNAEDLSRQTPGFVFDSPFGRQFDRPIIRGQANILGASGVSVFIDGVNVTQSIRSLNFGDIDQIEVIKGPQSALFGRNTYSGAINITSRQPTNDFKGEVSADIGQFGYLEFIGNSSGPIIEDKLFYSISGRYYDFDSEFDRPDNENPNVGNESSRSISASLKATPTDNWNLTFRAAYNEDDDGHFPIGLLGFEELNVNVPGGAQLGGTQPFFDGVVPATSANPSGGSQLSSTLGEGGGLEREELYLAVNSNYEFSNGYSLFATLGYTEEDFRDELDSDGRPGSFGTAAVSDPFPAPFIFPGATGVVLLPFDFTTTDDDHQETFVAEARIDSPADKALRWRAGVYYFDNQDEDRDLYERFTGAEFAAFQAAADASGAQAIADIADGLGVPGFSVINLGGGFALGPSNPVDTNSENISVFGSVSYDFSDKLSASVEGRYAEETIQEINYALDGDIDTGFSTGAITFEQEETFTAFTPRFTVDYQATPDNLLYGVVARGTKPGGFNGEDAADPAIDLGSFDEETLWTYEVGSKNVFADGQAVFNAAAFYTDLSGYQLTQNIAALLPEATTTGSVVANLGDVEIFGIELEASISPDAFPGFTLGGSYAYTDAEFSSGAESTQGLVFGNDDLTGQRLPRQAPHQASFFTDYNFDIGDSSNMLFSLTGSYQSSRFAQVQNLAETGDSYIMDARITYSFNDNYSISLYGKNITGDDSPVGVLRFIDTLGNSSFTAGDNLVPTVFDLRGASQSRGFQYNNRHGARGGIVLRAKF